MKIKGFAIMAILLISVGVVPIFTIIPIFAAGNTNSTNSTSAKINSTSTVTPSANATASKNSTSTAPPYTPPTGNPGTPSSGSSPITVTTDKSSYNAGDKITISGASTAYLSDTPVTIIIRNPIGNVIKVDQIPLGTDQTYSTSVTASGALWQAAGTYTVSVQFGSPDRSAKTTFNFTGVPVSQSQSTIPVDGTNFSITYTIINGTVLDIKADQPHTSVIVSIKTTGDGILTITLPRALIDSKNSDGTDKPYVVSNDGNIAQFNETSTTNTDRTLTIQFKNGTQQITIMGTFVIPEFGPIAALVLAIAIVSIIAVSSKSGIRFRSRY
jgi:predicted secreted protein with PEFG-CTERM motif